MKTLGKKSLDKTVVSSRDTATAPRKIARQSISVEDLDAISGGGLDSAYGTWTPKMKKNIEQLYDKVN